MSAKEFMPDPPELKNQMPSTFDPSIQTENIAYSQDEMLACDRCSRQNPPNRANCIYCGGELAIKAEILGKLKPVTRKLEAWEAGFNVVLRSALGGRVENIGSILADDSVDVAAIIRSKAQLPIARVESVKLAELLVEQLAGSGLECTVISDAELAVETPPVRLSTIRIDEGSLELIDFNTRTNIRVLFEDLALIVVGTLSKSRTELLEKRRRNAESKVIDEMATSADEMVLDLYTRSESRGFRIYLAGFDFSCLGERKGLLAAENMRQLAGLIAETAPNAKVANNYASIRHLLGGIWEVESRSDPQGLKRSGFGKVEFGKVETTSNLQQFNKYSRLQWHLL